MKLIRYDRPQNLLSDWDSFFVDPFRAFAPFFSKDLSADRNQVAHYGVEWYEDDEHYYARVELPGVKREDLKIDAEDGLLRLSFEFSKHHASKEGEVSREERYERILQIPEGVEAGGISARLSDGLLDLTLPKAAERRPVSVTIQ